MNASRLLAAVIGLHLVLGLVYDWATPVLEASDEGPHYALVHWLAQGHPLPQQQPEGPERLWAQEGSQPPLYYFLAARLTAWVEAHDFEQAYVRNPFARVGIPGTTHNANLYRHPAGAAPLTGTALAIQIARWFSLLLSGATIYLTFQLARRVFPGDGALALLASALVAFNPMTLFINASVNNDNLLMLLSTAALLVILHFMRPAVRGYASKAAGLGLLLGLAALTKVSGLILWPLAALGVGWGAWLGRDGRRFIVSGALLAGAALLVSGWWFWRNHVLYGEWLGLNTMVAVAGPRPHPITLLELIRSEWAGFWLSYWGIFGVFTIRTADWVYRLFDLLTLWAVAGGAWAIARAFRDRRAPCWPELSVLILFALLTLVGLVRWTMLTLASQGRLMFGAIAPLAILMAAGILTTIGPRWAHGVSLALTGTLALVAAIIPVAYIAPRYAPPRAMAESDLPHDLREIHVKFGEAIELIGYTVEDRPRAPGQSQPVTLYWRALKPMATDYALALHLLGREAAEVGKIDTWPGGGDAPTSQWVPGTIFADTYFLPIDGGAVAPSLLRLDLYFWDGDPARALPQTSLQGEALKSVNFRVGRLVRGPSPPINPEIVEGSRFEYGISLLGLDASVDGALYLVLYWRTEQPIPGDYTVFLHLTDAKGLLVLQADAPPLNGDWPTSAWVPGQAFADTRLMALPPNLAPGRYFLRLGFYDPPSGARLTAFRQDGTEWPDDIVVIERAVEIK